MGNDFDGPYRDSTDIPRRAHLAPSDTSPVYQVDRITPFKESHRTGCRRNRKSPDLPTVRMPRRHRDR